MTAAAIQTRAAAAQVLDYFANFPHFLFYMRIPLLLLLVVVY
jgi:hypothetical protein